ncbi:MAG: class I SAM-dependent RNA methyltransferase [Naasia sp.]
MLVCVNPDSSSAPELELEVGAVAHGGVFVARHEGRVVFVADALPGETVRARVVDSSKESFWRADALDVLVPSEDRQPHIWAEAGIDRDPSERVGGAEFGHIAPARQRTLKAEVLLDSLRRFGRVDTTGSAASVEALPGETDGTGWRTRVRLHADSDGLIGPYVARSHTVVATRTLPLAAPALREVAPVGQRIPGSPGLDLIATSTGDVRVVPVSGAEPGAPVVEVVGDRRFELAERGFWQVHTAAAATLSAAVRDAVQVDLFDADAANLDLYGGVGLLAAAVGDGFGRGVRITSVEADEAATGFARTNLADWPSADAVTARVDRYLTGLERSSRSALARIARGTVVLDPPRAGAGKQVMRALGRLRPAQLVYVACDPVALGRDIGLARDAGYRLTALRGFDLFPNTHHVEAVATLVRE